MINRLGTRNAPSLLHAGSASVFFWDGRRHRLEDAVIDPFVTSFEMGLPGIDDLVARIKSRPYAKQFQALYGDSLTEAQIGDALAAFVRAIPSQTRDGPLARERSPMTQAAEQRGRKVFLDVAQCGGCHRPAGNEPFSDNEFHPSALGMQDRAAQLPSLITQAMGVPSAARSVASAVGTSPALAEMGRFVVTKMPADINAFRTPSLINVGGTAPYMHNGAVATLEQAVDLEIYYRGLATGTPLQVSTAQRADLVAYLRSLKTTQPSVAQEHKDL